MLYFLRFVVQLCICEVSFLKQVYQNKKEGTDRQYKEIKMQDTTEKKRIWENALKKEAVHLLLLNKFNVGIDKLRESMLEVFKGDEVFENMLFEASD